MSSPLDKTKPEAKIRSDQNDTRQRIIKAAIQVFSQKGYLGATTRAIAAAAGVNEVTLFRHFGSKENLLRAAIDQYSPLPGLERLIETEFSGDYRQDLLKLGHYFLAKLTESWQKVERRKTMIMALQEIDRRPELRDLVLPVFRRIRHLLREYLQQQIEQGRVRNLDTEVMAEAILGMFFSYALLEPLVTESSVPALPSEQLVAQFVDIFVEGTSTKTTES